MVGSWRRFTTGNIDDPVSVLDKWDVHCSLYSPDRHLSLHHHRDVWVRVKMRKADSSVLGKGSRS